MSGAGRVCAVHGEWCPTGECRWCAPAPLPMGGGKPDEDGYLVPPRLREALLGLEPDAGIQTLKASPTAPCFCGRWHFTEAALLPSGYPASPPRDPDGALHTPDACGRFEPASPESLRVNFGTMKITAALIEKYAADVRFTLGEHWLHGDLAPRPNPEQAPPPTDVLRLVPCACGGITFDLAASPIAQKRRAHTGDGARYVAHASAACLDRCNRRLTPSVRCACGARKVPADVQFAADDIEGARDRHSVAVCVDVAGITRTYALEHP